MLAPSVLVSSGERFVKWVEDQYPHAQWFVETPVSGTRSAGGNWNGTIDLMLRLPSGQVVVIDHKSAPLRREHCEAKAGQFTGQLAAYSEIFASTGETIESTWIHFPSPALWQSEFDAMIAAQLAAFPINSPQCCDIMGID